MHHILKSNYLKDHVIELNIIGAMLNPLCSKFTNEYQMQQFISNIKTIINSPENLYYVVKDIENAKVL